MIIFNILFFILALAVLFFMIDAIKEIKYNLIAAGFALIFLAVDITLFYASFGIKFQGEG
jgi:hypothetical protein